MAPLRESVYVVDVGSVARGNFAWVSSAETAGDRPEELVEAIGEDVARVQRVSLGFECPLFVPCPMVASSLGRARVGEGNRPFSAGAGAGSLVTGQVQLAWVLRALALQWPGRLTATLDPAVFERGEAHLLIWEAFVTGRAKGTDHCSDARAALAEYARRRAAGGPWHDVHAEGAFSLAGAAILWSGLSDDPAILHQTCAVVKVKP